MIGLWHQVLSGLATGGIYASLALALVMIYQATHHVNFAQGEMATFSTFLALGWGLAASIGAVAGLLIAPVVFLDPNMMTGTLLYAFAGALLGGLDSPVGAVLGGFLVGVIENLGGAYLVGTELKLTLAL